MTNEFIREARYAVLKSEDVMQCLTVSELIELRRIQAKVEEHRAEIGKPPLDCVVVESDWPEYEPTWRAIEARVAGAQPAPSEKDEPIRKAWARFSNALHRSPDAPYPGMSEAFEQHFSQSFTDREWRAESGTWAAAWKAAKNHGAQPAPSFADAYQGAMEEVAIWKRRALEAEDLNRKFIAEINGPTHMGEPAQPAPSVPVDILYRLGAAHDACLDGDHRACRDAITQLMCEIGPDGAVPEPKP